jgi:hypothetical protein
VGLLQALQMALAQLDNQCRLPARDRALVGPKRPAS